jgi:hypothetical protein
MTLPSGAPALEVLKAITANMRWHEGGEATRWIRTLVNVARPPPPARSSA